MNPHRSRRAIQLSNNREASRLKPLPTCCVRTVPLHRKIRRTARSVVVAFILSTRDRSSSPLLRFILLPSSSKSFFLFPSPRFDPTTRFQDTYVCTYPRRVNIRMHALSVCKQSCTRFVASVFPRFRQCLCIRLVVVYSRWKKGGEGGKCWKSIWEEDWNTGSVFLSVSSSLLFFGGKAASCAPLFSN